MLNVYCILIIVAKINGLRLTSNVEDLHHNDVHNNLEDYEHSNLGFQPSHSQVTFKSLSDRNGII